jgi:hypothetical protein
VQRRCVVHRKKTRKRRLAWLAQARAAGTQRCQLGDRLRLLPPHQAQPGRALPSVILCDSTNIQRLILFCDCLHLMRSA